MKTTNITIQIQQNTTKQNQKAKKSAQNTFTRYIYMQFPHNKNVDKSSTQLIYNSFFLNRVFLYHL